MRKTRGKRPCAPKTTVGLTSAYSVGTRSTRKPEKATCEDVPFRVLTAGKRKGTCEATSASFSPARSTRSYSPKELRRTRRRNFGPMVEKDLETPRGSRAVRTGKCGGGPFELDRPEVKIRPQIGFAFTGRAPLPDRWRPCSARGSSPMRNGPRQAVRPKSRRALPHTRGSGAAQEPGQ